MIPPPPPPPLPPSPRGLRAKASANQNSSAKIRISERPKRTRWRALILKTVYLGLPACFTRHPRTWKSVSFNSAFQLKTVTRFKYYLSSLCRNTVISLASSKDVSRDKRNRACLGRAMRRSETTLRAERNYRLVFCC